MPLANWNHDFKEIAGDFPSVLVYNALTINCTSSDTSEEFIIDERGDYDPKSKDVLTTLSDWQGSIPEDRETVTLDDVKYYVADKQQDTHTDTLRLTIKRV